MAVIDTTCPQCSAPHARKLSLIYSEGLTNTSANIQTVGKFNTIGGAKITTKGTTTGVQQTQASRNAAPPTVPEIFTFGTLLRGGLMLLGCACGIGGIVTGTDVITIVGILTALGAFAVPTSPTPDELATHMEQTKSQRAELEAWEKTFECHACGNRFVPN